MAAQLQTKRGLTGNQLKIIAMITMTIDHVGIQIFPNLLWMRIIGRLAMPIYAYMIAEGCRHTRNRKKYLLRLLGMGALCQIVYLVAMGSLYQCILITFSMSVSLIWLMDAEGGKLTVKAQMGIVLVFFICVILPKLLPNTDFYVDYGLTGVLLPVLIYSAGNKGLLLGLALVALQHGGIQWLAFLSMPLLLQYNGKRGTANIGKLFYWYYPVHLVIIYVISLLI